jgi:pimeloyl-ACP methyl ester carboxylesterase
VRGICYRDRDADRSGRTGQTYRLHRNRCDRYVNENSSTDSPPSVGHEIAVGDVAIEVNERGSGRPLLLLHPGYPSGRTDVSSAVVEQLAQSFRVICPTHPGFGRADAPKWMTTVDDLAYLYLELLDVMELEDVVLVGSSFGGWIAAEIAVKSTSVLSHLVLVDPVGIKVSDRETRDIEDIYAVVDQGLAELAYVDTSVGLIKSRDLTRDLTDDEILFLARSREATARYGWSPYLHDPKLRRRLRRIDVPSLVLWGTEDRVVNADYAKTFASSMSNGQFAEVPGAGHFPVEEAPTEVARLVREFAEEPLGSVSS